MFTAEQAATGVFCLVLKTCLFQKGALWGPRAMFTAEQVAAGVFLFSEKRHAFLRMSVLIDIGQ